MSMVRAIFTFDDGYRTVINWSHRHHLPATIFIVPGLIESGKGLQNLPLLTWKDCKWLLDQGCEFGCHTLRHVRADEQSETMFRSDLEECERLLKLRLGIKTPLFAYPWHVVMHLNIAREFYPRIRSPYGMGRIVCGDLQTFVWHDADDPIVDRFTRSLVFQGATFLRLSEQLEWSPIFL
jgi:peptidoglycan/xylan/chitin deacetylase (PgdA/CDA1 family)